jgi:hypothetical protein
MVMNSIIYVFGTFYILILTSNVVFGWKLNRILKDPDRRSLDRIRYGR